MTHKLVDFTQSATRLSGQTAILLGWRPDEFWRATPAELHAVVTALLPPECTLMDRSTLSQLQGHFPDG